ncbi:hypothetical protein DENSPDRAFT_852025 [Dentipellis sp. KUC8613]|nr:hypothetical protein DENSPDRAFT_852025 [Dentipellis sp. KUC8613]
MAGQPSNQSQSPNSFPPSPWNLICDPVLAQTVSAIPAASPYSPHARAAETARAASLFHQYNHNIPLAEAGFHGGFIREPRARKETRERIVELMQNLASRYFSNVRHPQLVEDIQPTVSLISPPIPTQQPPDSSMPGGSQPPPDPYSAPPGGYGAPSPGASSAAPAGASGAASPPHSYVNVSPRPTPPRSTSHRSHPAPTPPQSRGQSHRSYTSSEYESLLSPLSNVSLGDLPGSPPSVHSHGNESRARSDSQRDPASPSLGHSAAGSGSRQHSHGAPVRHLMDLLASLRQQELADAVLNVYYHVGRSARLDALQDLGFNHGTALALALLMG